MKKLFTLALLLTLSSALFAATLRVNNAPDTSPDHPTIQAAINAATTGDTILIEGSAMPYAGFTLTNKRLNLIGPGYLLTSNLGTPANKLGAMISSPASYVRTSSGSGGSADGSLVMGLEFYSELILEACANVTVARCLINYQSGGRLTLNAPAVTVRQCLFLGPSPIEFRAAYYGQPATSARIENCLFPNSTLSIPSSIGVVYLNNNLLYGLSLSSTPTQLSCDNNLFVGSLSSNLPGIYRNNLFSGSLPPSGLNGTGNVGNVNFSHVMANYQNSSASLDGRYQLAPLTIPPTGGPANPALNAGTDGTHIGPFGGANPYILSGIPPLPTIDELSVPQFAAPGGNVTIRVKVGERP